MKRFFIFAGAMLPDYAHKTFMDKRINYSLLMHSLAMRSGSWLCTTKQP